MMNAMNVWVDPCLWTGLVPYMGALAISIFGSYEEVAHSMLAYKELGISQFLLIGFYNKVEMTHFSEGVMPIIHQLEQSQNVIA